MRVCVYCGKKYNKTGRGVYCNDKCKREEYKLRKNAKNRQNKIDANDKSMLPIDNKWLTRGTISS